MRCFVFRPNDASQKRFSWFSDWIQKVLFSKKTHVNLVDLVKSFPTSIYYLLAKIGFDRAENEPLSVCQTVVKDS